MNQLFGGPYVLVVLLFVSPLVTGCASATIIVVSLIVGHAAISVRRVNARDKEF
jgi:hypothetical protein